MRIKIAHIALILSILALVISLFTAVQAANDDSAALIDALMAQNQQLQAQIDALAERTGDAAADTHGAVLTAAAWEDGRGADVTLTLEAAPAGDALLRVMADDNVISEAPCQWDGTAFTATARVPAGNGYTYTMVVGSEATTLASPENPVYPELVNLADALSAYCNLVVGEWYVKDDVLTLETGYASLHTPQLADGGEAYTDARLVLKHGEEILAETPISPAETEEPGTFACAITDAAFAMPTLPEGEEVDLWLEVTLSDGQTLSTCAATWYAMHSGYSMAAG